jgi:hypothetical protein
MEVSPRMRKVSEGGECKEAEHLVQSISSDQATFSLLVHFPSCCSLFIC